MFGRVRLIYGLDLVDVLLPIFDFFGGYVPYELLGSVAVDVGAVGFDSAKPGLPNSESFIETGYRTFKSFMLDSSTIGGMYGGTVSFLATLFQSTPSKNLCYMISRISKRTFGSVTRIFLTISLVTGVIFFGRMIRPEFTISTI